MGGRTRRSISLKGTTYQRLKNYCETEGRSISGYLELIIAERLDAASVPVPDQPPPAPRRAKDEYDGAHFTF